MYFQKQKRKLEAPEPHAPTVDTKVHVEESQNNPEVTKGSGQGTNNNISVSIVQQISGVKQDSPQTFRTELTVTRNNNNTGGTGYPSAPPAGATQSSANNEPNVECKLEPTEDTQCSESSSSSHTSLLEGLEDIPSDELQTILDTWDRHPEDDIITVLDKLTENDPVDHLSGVDSKDRDFGNLPMEAFSDLPCKQSVFDGINAQGNLNAGQVYSNNTGHQINDMGAPGVQNTPPYRQPTPQPPVVHTPGPSMNSMAPSPLLGDTGPASETLKQMASKHQNQGYASEPSPTTIVNPGVPQYPNQGYNTMPGAASDSVYSYGQQGGRPPMQMSHQGPIDPKGMHGAYGNTKALTHYNASPDAASASSLQQLQNQMNSHFGPEQGQTRASQAQPLQITQTQHMQVSHGNQHMQLSQTQQMHINGRPGQQISLAQQQTFSVAQENALPQQQEGANYINDSRKMHLLQQQAKARQGEESPIMDNQVQPGYINRPPPPEYQQRGYPPSSIGASPLQTMQNMVNQTSSPITHDSMAPGPKAEYSRVQHHRAPHMQGQVPQPNGAVHHNMANYQAHSRFPAYPQGEQIANPNIYQGAAQTRPKSNNSNFKSAIMRGQRPPNVNVGPEGLNISHSGPPVMEWQRHMMSPRPPCPMPSQMDQMARGNMHPNAMGQFYAAQGGMAMGQGVSHGMQMTQQQAMHMQQQQAMGSHQMNNMGSRSAMMMMQQQRMQMHAAQQPMSTGMAMAQSAAGMASMPGPQPQTNAPNGNYPMNPGANPNFPMEYIDNPQTSGQDLFDSMVQNPGSADFNNLIDEILK